MRFMLCDGQACCAGGKELLDAWRAQAGSWLWLDLFDEPVESETAFLAQHFSLDPGAMAEAQRSRHPPSFEAFDNSLYLLLKPLDAESDSLDFNTLQLAMFAGERFLVTRRSAESPYLNKLWHGLLANVAGDETPLWVMLAMSRRVVQRYGRVLLDLEQRVDEIEDELFASPTDALMKELVGYNTGLRKMHRILAYYVDVFSALRQHMHRTGQPPHDEFDDIYALVERFHSMSLMYQGVLSDLIEAYISLNGHRLNQIMKVLTIVTVMFVPLSLLVGIYGMNFENMPELKSRYGYYVLLSSMTAIVLMMLFVFRRVRWL